MIGIRSTIVETLGAYSIPMFSEGEFRGLFIRLTPQ